MFKLNFRNFAILFFPLSLLLFSPASEAAKYSKYTNPRFGYSISYPSDLFIAQGESDNGDGQKFVSADGAVLLVYGSYNVTNESLKEYYADVIASNANTPNQVLNVTYKQMKDNFFVFSGTLRSKIIYQKTILRNGIFKSFRLIYDQSQKKTYDPVIRNLLLSFKG
ncbi:MAG: hypothetical protein ACXVB4_19515 [Pseudobdellovibrionaceae bacterium]